MNEIVTEKQCKKCGIVKPAANFYNRTGYPQPTHPGHLLTNCKDCMRATSKKQVHKPKTEPVVLSEALTISYLHSKGIPSLPGKAVSAVAVDIVSYGAVFIECKHARLETQFGKNKAEYHFVLTPKQQKLGFRANIVVLICEPAPGEYTFHFFPSTHPVFYMDGRLKTSFSFRPGSTGALKFAATRTVMTQSMMDAAQDASWLIKDALNQIEQKLKAGEVLPFEQARLAS